MFLKSVGALAVIVGKLSVEAIHMVEESTCSNEVKGFFFFFNVSCLWASRVQDNIFFLTVKLLLSQWIYFIGKSFLQLFFSWKFSLNFPFCHHTIVSLRMRLFNLPLHVLNCLTCESHYFPFRIPPLIIFFSLTIIQEVNDIK